jgi:hypothetical protein
MKEEAAEKKANTPKNLYPILKIHKNSNPSKFYAIPLVGFLVKIVLLIPVLLEGLILGFIFFFVWIINSFVILFSGEYWNTAYDFFLGLMQFYTKITLYVYGLIDKYPGFGLSADKQFELQINKPEKPNRLFAIPVFGLIARGIMMIPYHIFSQVMSNGSWVAMIISWFPILVYGKFPEATYEFESDSIRVSLAAFSYMTGLRDNYPSFSISMNHQTIKILLIIAGALLTLNNFKNYATQRRTSIYQYNQYNNMYNQNPRNRMYQQMQNNMQYNNPPAQSAPAY